MNTSTPTTRRVWITGASGFVGHQLCLEAVRRGWSVLASSRTASRQPPETGIEWISHQQALGAADLGQLDAVIHVAARAHQLKETAADPAAAFRLANVDVSLAVARAAKQAGAARFVYVSSIGVNGDATRGQPFRESDTPNPVEPYAVSKLEAEQALREHCAASGLQLAIVRPPLVYGLGAPGNFARLLKLAQSGLPLPLAAVDNQRSFVAVENLCDLLLCLAVHPAAAGELFLVADGEDFSTPRLLRLLAQAAGAHSRLWSLPPGLLRAGAALLGQQRTFDKLCGSLQVDASKARQLLAWTPPLSAAEGLAAWAANAGKEAGE